MNFRIMPAVTRNARLNSQSEESVPSDVAAQSAGRSDGGRGG